MLFSTSFLLSPPLYIFFCVPRRNILKCHHFYLASSRSCEREANSRTNRFDYQYNQIVAQDSNPGQPLERPSKAGGEWSPPGPRQGCFSHSAWAFFTSSYRLTTCHLLIFVCLELWPFEVPFYHQTIVWYVNADLIFSTSWSFLTFVYVLQVWENCSCIAIMVQKYQSPVRVYKQPFELIMAVSAQHSSLLFGF